MSQGTTSKIRLPISPTTIYVTLPILLIASAVGGALATRWYIHSQAQTGDSAPANHAATAKLIGHAAQHGESAESLIETATAKVASSESKVEFPQSQWESSGLKIETAAQSPFNKLLTLTGKITLNQDRIAHIYPMVDGAVESVLVGLGQDVKANDLLVTIHSREIGDAKLQLYQSRLQLTMAQTKDRLQSEIAKNARELLDALRQNMPIQEIEIAFRKRAMGDFRERALATYSNYLKSDADVMRLESVVESGAISGKQLTNAKANRNADQATFQSRIEQIEYELGTSVLLSQQAVKEAEAKVLVAATSLRILGCDQADIEEIDPQNQGESLSHYNIRAPFDGTILTKDVVLREQVRPDVMLLSIADLSTVWVTADIYEEHLPLLGSMTDQIVTIRNKSLPDRVFEARVFYTGEVMDEASRTISLRAIADNPDHLLKPGMFITVELSGASEIDVLQIPVSAIQEYEGQKFVFVHIAADQFERRNILVGDSNSSSVVILSGLNVGEKVVTDGGFLLKSLMLAELMGEE